jgi:hypothetical protein
MECPTKLGFANSGHVTSLEVREVQSHCRYDLIQLSSINTLKLEFMTPIWDPKICSILPCFSSRGHRLPAYCKLRNYITGRSLGAARPVFRV